MNKTKFLQESIARYRWVLASQSPRRQLLLSRAGFCFKVIAASDAAEDGINANETPGEFVARQAYQKANDVAGQLRRGEIALDNLRPTIIIGCDTVAVCEGEILGKPRDMADARRMLQRLGGNQHEALSGLCLLNVTSDKTQIETDRTILYMRPWDEASLEIYLALKHWEGKAGAFGYQDGIDWLEIIEGSESNVVGLPLELLARMIENLSQL